MIRNQYSAANATYRSKSVLHLAIEDRDIAKEHFVKQPDKQGTNYRFADKGGAVARSPTQSIRIGFDTRGQVV